MAATGTMRRPGIWRGGMASWSTALLALVELLALAVVLLAIGINYVLCGMNSHAVDIVRHPLAQ